MENDAAPQRTWEPLPVMLEFENIHLQLVDTPPLSRDFAEPGLKELIRHADLVVLVVDLQQDPIEQLQDTIALLEEYRIAPQDRQDRYLQGQPMTFLPFLVLVNKCDDQPAEELYQIFCELHDEKWPCMPVSAFTGRNLDRLKREMVEKLDLIRVYTKAPGKEPDFTRPYAMKEGSTVEDLAGRIHKDFLEKMKSARVWGKAVFDRQQVQRDYVLQDGDIVEIHI
jgi:ribosome-interacting GTPase 1